MPPVTAGGPPVWIGGHSAAALRRALRFGDGWYGTGADAAEGTDVRRRLRDLAGAESADRLTLASAAFLTPPGIPAVVPPPEQPLGGAAPTATSVADGLGRLAEASSRLAPCGCLSRLSMSRRPWRGSQPRWHRDSPDGTIELLGGATRGHLHRRGGGESLTRHSTATAPWPTPVRTLVIFSRCG
ncbi:hypothetical protein [Streptomyces sp. NBC_00091]|uniref:hypothetical protein n=1 Tax=Streptomyces sp. NBC_00091 TaxID=2975648 RepID=UPI0022573D2F|nr:hypothetical protein [Streptomyces sp. NBC_00091]MCX5380389.1 hypothetical protein [Streptomyces sp. NBC_00091]